MGSDGYKNAIPKTCELWHEGALEDSPNSSATPRRELEKLFPHVMSRVETCCNPGKPIDAQVEDKFKLYLIQVIEYERNCGYAAGATRGVHCDNVTNEAHLLVGHTGGS